MAIVIRKERRRFLHTGVSTPYSILMNEVAPKDFQEYLTTLPMWDTCATRLSAIPLYVCCAHRAILSRHKTTSMIPAYRSLMSLWDSHCFRRAYYTFLKVMRCFQESPSITTARGFTLQWA